MKKVLLFLILFIFAAAFAEENQGIRANVELVTGTKQSAIFLGVKQDTVLLGGNIKGQFMVVRIPKNRFKSVVDEAGNNLLNPVATIDTTATKVPDNSDSTQVVVQDTLQDSTATQEIVESKEPTYLDSVAGKHIFVAMERRSIDSALSEQMTPLLVRLLQESGIPVSIARRTNFGYCRENSCIRDSLAKYGAASAYLGSIAAGSSNDSLSILMTHVSFVDSASHMATMSLSVFKALSDGLSNNKLSNFLKLLQGEEIPVAKKGTSYVKMESDPEGATISIPGRNEVCKTPCSFALQDTGKQVLYAYWNVNNQLWGAKETIRPIPGDTLKISSRLKKVKPELRIYTVPEGAAIYAGSSPIAPNTAPIGKTPNKFDIYEPGPSFVQIRKEGYKDTLVSFFASPTEITDLNITLQPINNFFEAQQQKEWSKAQKRDFIGKVLMGSSIAPIVAGALLAYLGSQDYNDAERIKNDLNKPATLNGANYQAKVNENHDLVHKGDRKMIIGGSLAGAGILMFGVGFLLTF